MRKKKLKKQNKCLLETLFDKVLNTMLPRKNITEASIFHEITFLIIKNSFNNDSYFFPFSSEEIGIFPISSEEIGIYK